MIGALVEGFVNPALLAGVLLAGVPILIHLLNRQRHKPVPWAAMRFAQLAFRRTRRRVQFENWLLLLLRTAAVALFAFAITRPFLGGDSPLAGLTESRRDLVLIVDGSASTGYRQDVESVFEREIARSRELIRGLDEARGDRVRLILASGVPRLLSWTGPTKALELLETLSRPADEPLDLTAALNEVADIVDEDAAGTTVSRLEVRLLTDMQRRAFRGALEEPLDRLRERGVRVRVEDLQPIEAGATPPNAGVVAIEPVGGLLGPGTPIDVTVSVRNFGERDLVGARVAIEVDGERRPARQLDVPARETAQAVFTVTFAAPGAHVLSATNDGDALGIDDRLEHVLDVPAAVRVLGVNGSPVPDDPIRDELGFLSAVLDPLPADDAPRWAERPPFELREISPGELGGTDLFEYDVVWLANVSSVSPEAAQKLTERTAAGGAVIVSLGDFVDASLWNSRLFSADGTGLLPAELLRVTSVSGFGAARGGSRGGTNYWRIRSFDEDHPVLRFFAEERWRNLLIELPIYEFFAVRPLADAKVLATLDDENASPLLVERRFDRGRVLLWTTSIDSQWTLFPEVPRSFVPLVHELLRHASREEQPPRNVAPGEPLVAEVGAFPRRMELAFPDGTRRPLEGEPETMGPNRWRLPLVPGRETERVGLYRIELDGDRSLPFSVAVDPEEGDLERLSGPELEGLHDVLTAVAAASTADGDRDGLAGNGAGTDGELWRGLALACLLALIGESLWAAWIGSRRSVR